MVKIYFWRLTYSGTVLPPEEIRKKQKVKTETKTNVMWELTFENPPFFRSFSSNADDVYKRYDKLIRQLIEEQEFKSVLWVSGTRRLGLLSWSRWVDGRSMAERWLEMYKKLNLTKEEEEALMKGLVKTPMKPHFRVDDYSIEKALEPIELPAEKGGGIFGRIIVFIRNLMGAAAPPPVRTANDVYKFRVYRPPYGEEDAIGGWSGEFVHDL